MIGPDLAQFADSLLNISMVGLMSAMIVGTLFPGIPEELFIILIGSAVATGSMSFRFAFLTVLITLVCLDMIWYWAGRTGNKVMWKFYEKAIGLPIEDETTLIWKHRKKLVFFSRFAPFIRFIGPFSAGVIKMPVREFFVWNVFALSVYVPIMMWIGLYFHDRIDKIIIGSRVAGNSIWIGVGLVVLALLLVGMRKVFKSWYIKRMTDNTPASVRTSPINNKKK